jgi:hypothetical protein
MKITHITAPGLGSQVPGMIYRILETLIQIALITLKAILLSTAGCPETTIQISASTTIVIPRIENTFPDSICDSGNATLQATASNGNAYWYTTVTGGSARVFTTPTISTTTSYYVDTKMGIAQTYLEWRLLQP